MSNQPAYKARIGYVSVTVWKNDGTTTPFYTIDVSRSYKDDDGAIKNSNSLNHADLLNAAHLLQLANDWILAQ